MELYRQNEYERGTPSGEHVYTEMVYEPATLSDLKDALAAHGMDAVPKKQECSHMNVAPDWSHVTCRDCGKVRRDGSQDWL